MGTHIKPFSFAQGETVQVQVANAENQTGRELYASSSIRPFLQPSSNQSQWILQWHECLLQRVVDDPEKRPLLPEQMPPFQTSTTKSKFVRQDIRLIVAHSSGEVIHISSLALLKV
jgi:hypothetical protein